MKSKECKVYILSVHHKTNFWINIQKTFLKKFAKDCIICAVIDSAEFQKDFDFSIIFNKIQEKI